MHLAPDAAPRSGVDVASLVAELQRLPAQRPALLTVVQLADDPDCSLRRLADAVAADPAFAQRVLRLANSAYYGRPSQVTALPVAVGVLGADALRGLAVTMSLGLAGEHGPLPERFWEFAATTAAGSELLAPVTGASPGDAFCVGLLADVGLALLFRADPDGFAPLLRQPRHALPVAERAWCGTTDGEVAEATLRAAGLPPALGAAVADEQRHDEQGSCPDDPLARALRGGRLLARAVAAGEVDADVAAQLDEVTGGVLERERMPALALRVAGRAVGLTSTLR